MCLQSPKGKSFLFAMSILLLVALIGISLQSSVSQSVPLPGPCGGGENGGCLNLIMYKKSDRISLNYRKSCLCWKKNTKIVTENPGEDAYEFLHNEATKHPFNLPFHLPLEQTRTYLGHFRKNLLYELFRAFAVDEKYVAMEYLGLSQEE